MLTKILSYSDKRKLQQEADEAFQRLLTEFSAQPQQTEPAARDQQRTGTAASASN